MTSEAGVEAHRVKVFISYSRNDRAFADRLDATLRERGFDVLIDRTEIYAFEDWWARIQSLISRADTIIFVLSPESVTSPVCAKEVAFAASLNKRFAPVVVDRVDDKLVPEALGRLNFVFFDDEAKFAESFERLCEALRTNIDWIRKHTEYGEAARRWEAEGQPAGLLLRPPALDQAEAWMAFRPSGVSAATAQTEAFVVASRRAVTAARRRNRILNASLYTMLVSIILGLVGWINQDFLKAQWHWWTIERPYFASQVWPHVLTAEQEHALKPGQSFHECAKDCPPMIVVPAGTFMMGSPPNDPNGYYTNDNELPQHKVTIAKPFAVGEFDVTFDDWDACIEFGDCSGVSDGGFGRGRRPVINVTWDEAQHYAAWLSKVTGKAYRLLSESEWEYAARAGTKTEFYWGNDVGKNNADCNGCKSKWDGLETAPVGSFSPNQFGLYDMAGNVSQWAEDCYHDSYEIETPQGSVAAPANGSAWTSGSCKYRVVRGGSWGNNPLGLRPAIRDWTTPDNWSNDRGFRLARSLDMR